MNNHHHHLPPPPPEPCSSTDVAAPNPTTEPPNSTTRTKTNVPQCSSYSPNPTTEPPNSTTGKKTNLPQSSSSSTWSHSPSRIKRRFKVPVRTSLGSTKRSGAGRGSLGPVRGSLGREDIDALALPLGMAVAAVIAQVLERNYADVEKISADHLSVICSSAVKESLSYVFGDSFDGFGRNFEKSFRSTLQTLRFVNESSQASAGEHAKSWTRERLPEIAPHSTSYKQEHSTCSSIGEICQEESELMSNVDIHSNILEDTDRVMHQQLTLHRFQSDQQLACVSSSTDIFNSEHSQSMISTFRKSVMEQSRSNDLKELELGLVRRRLQLEEKQLDVMSEANSLGRSKLSMSYSMASFKAGKFKTELEDTRCAELLRQFLDCLMFGLVLMLGCLAYGIYIFSFERITDATSACTPSKDSKSWWKPQVMKSLDSGMRLAWCYAQALGRITIATSVIVFAIMCLLTKRSASSNQTMPLTFIILVLGVGIGYIGKYCIDTLGGSGYYWLLHWEVLCFLHFLSIVFTKRFYGILYGPVTPFPQTKSSILSPYVLKRIIYYTVMLLVLPLSCGLLPFASIGQWSDHFLGQLFVEW